ncbi:MAG TPA: CsbD family protein [Acidimicrobiales bacterium]|nr:CsbD family protein [Acidimicrobiales bacterium]
MGTRDKAKNKIQEVRGKLKEKAGDITGDKELRAHGKKDQCQARIKQAREKVKDVFGHRSGP